MTRSLAFAFFLVVLSAPATDVSAAFSDSGFVLAKLVQVDSPANESTTVRDCLLFSLDIDGVDADRFEGIFEATGEIASVQGLQRQANR